jgi:hypothetical protein
MLFSLFPQAGLSAKLQGEPENAEKSWGLFGGKWVE